MSGEPENRRPPLGHRANGLSFADVAVWLLLWLAYFLVCAWFGLLLGFVCAYFFGNLLPITFLGWTGQDWAWIAGAIVGLLAPPLGQGVRMGPLKNFPRPPWYPTSAPREQILPEAMGLARPERPLWVTSDAMNAALLFGIVGGFLAFLLSTSWWSIAMSPFAPASWAESISYRAAYIGNAGQVEEGGLSSQHPLAFILFLGPPVVLALVGFFLGGFGGVSVSDGKGRTRGPTSD